MRRALPSLLVAATTALAAAIFYAQLHHRLQSDLPAHVLIAQSSSRTGSFPGDGLYFLLLALVTGFTGSLAALKTAAVIVLALAVGAKVLLSIAFARSELAPRAAAGALAAVGFLSLAFSLPTQTEYVGQLPPNVWHNSTSIFLMPFALALFWCSLRFLRTGDVRWLGWSAAALAANVVTKPSLVLAFLLAFPLLAARRFSWRSRAGRGAVGLLALAVALLAAQYAYVYFIAPDAGHVAGVETATSSVTIAPGRVWRGLSASVPLSFLASFAFPLAALAAYRRRLLESDAVRYALVLAAGALIIFGLLAETGPRALHGNFGWGVIVANYILFLAVLVQVARLWSPRARPAFADVAVALVFAAHIGAGVWFLHVWWHTGSYA